jgi:16S rRNA processing protein RimM
MSKNQEMRLIGKIKDAHGLRGDIYVIFFSKDYSWADLIEELYIEDTPYNVVKLAEHKDGLKIQLEGFTNRNQSEALIGKQVFLPADFFFTDDDEEGIFLSEIENFKVIDEVLGEVGTITGFSSNVAQDLLVVTSSSGKEYDIPFVNEFIVEIKRDDKVLLMKLPEGLLEINDPSKAKE